MKKSLFTTVALLIYGLLSPLISQAQTPTVTPYPCNISVDIQQIPLVEAPAGYSGSITHMYKITVSGQGDLYDINVWWDVDWALRERYYFPETGGVAEGWIDHFDNGISNSYYDRLYIHASFPYPYNTPVPLPYTYYFGFSKDPGEVFVFNLACHESTHAPTITPTTTATTPMEAPTNTATVVPPTTTATRQPEPAPTNTSPPRATATTAVEATTAPALTPSHLTPDTLTPDTYIYLPLVVK